MIIRPTTRDDIIEMTGTTFPENIRAISAEHDGELMGVAGIRSCDPRLCFADIKPELKKSPRTIIKMARWVTDIIKKGDAPVYALADEDEPTAFRFLEHVGFQWIMSTDQGEVFKWPQ